MVYNKIYRLKNLEASRKYSREYNKRRRKEDKEYAQKWRDSSNMINRNRKLEIIYYYSNGLMICNCCGETHLEFLTIDHINNDGYIFRKTVSRSGNAFHRWLIRNNFPEGFQVLCMNCNCSKSWFGFCPHQKNSYI